MEIKRKLEEQRRMQRIWKIYEHPLFIEGLVKNKDAEKERVFDGAWICLWKRRDLCDGITS